MATFELYRRSTIGMCLTETLDEMVSNGILTPDLAIQVLVQFDKSMTEALDSQVKSKVTIKGEDDSLPKSESFRNWEYAFFHCAFLQFYQSLGLVQALSLLITLPKAHYGILKVDVSVFSSGHNAKVKLQLQNCSETWILHWGCISNANKKWFVPSFYPSGTTVYKKAALSTPFVKDGDAYVLDIELRDPKIHAIEFVKNDGAGNAKCLLNETSHKENIENPLRHRNLCITPFLSKFSTSSSTWQGLSQKNNAFSNVYVMSLEETSSEMVGEKSCSIRFLNKEGPEWMKFPASIVLPYGVFEKVLSEDINKEVAKKIASLGEHVDRGDLSKLNTIQETVLQMKAPRRMSNEVRKKMKSSRLPWPRGRGEDTWTRIWHAMKMVWASKWNERAYTSCRNTNTNYDKLCIGILIQEYIRPDYAFVTYTHHPVSQDSSEIYTEIVKGSVETLVGASLGRPMCCITKKSDLKSPIVTCYPSKSTGLYTKNTRSIIFRPDFISDNTNGYTGNGIYDRESELSQAKPKPIFELSKFRLGLAQIHLNISLEDKEEVVLDYSRDRLVTDLRFQALIHSKIAETAKIIEDLYGCGQIVEGVVQDEENMNAMVTVKHWEVMVVLILVYNIRLLTLSDFANPLQASTSPSKTTPRPLNQITNITSDLYWLREMLINKLTSLIYSLEFPTKHVIQFQLTIESADTNQLDKPDKCLITINISYQPMDQSMTDRLNHIYSFRNENPSSILNKSPCSPCIVGCSGRSRKALARYQGVEGNVT
ncbi:hypothetical protein M8C21_028899 [Ambrosia artemisiifolia]|uniref:Pyruvate phosphate dikinase AMP/ATP-binding domain-containing protein n=1 Tax=Ambrosia artemisiifolia TaxID=4212 RepID=A0AAD5D720_AMBAR|nr:hypothetical protein M8C21_028899 [Ambrosia artemisiifolia]